MALWELLIAGAVIPAFYFFWLWIFRILAMITVAKVVPKLIEQAKESVLKGFKNKEDDTCTHASTAADTQTTTGAV